MKKIVLMVAIGIVMVTCSKHETYSTTMKVVEVIEGGSQKNDLIFVVDANGEKWSFEADDLEVDDMVSVTMHNNFTPDNIYDDTVVNIGYCAFE